MTSPKPMYSVLLCCVAFLIQAWHAESSTEVHNSSRVNRKDGCNHLEEYSGQISYASTIRSQNFYKCWYINPPERSLVHLKFLTLNLATRFCYEAFVHLSDEYGNSEICPDSFNNRINKTIDLSGAVNITLYVEYYKADISFSFKYDTESVICADENHFRCSSRKCIDSTYVCDGVEDCENGLDERECAILTIKGANESRIGAINWLKTHKTNFGWGKNTHRAITSLYLTGAAEFQGKDKDDEISVKDLQLKTAASLLRNLTAPMSVNELSMYVNALLVTCHNIRSIFAEDLLDILANRAFSSSSPSPGAYLTLCNANWPFSERNVYKLINFLLKDTEYPFALEIRAMTIMALSCLKKKTSFIHNGTSVYDETVLNFIKSQNKDGSFGNAHTTALVTQALLSIEEDEDTKMNVRNAMQFLIKRLNSSADFLSVYLSLPLFNGKTLVDIGSVDCQGYERKLEEDEDIIDVMDKLGTKIHVQYSLYIGDKKSVIHNLYLKVLGNSTVYDVMKVAEIADPKYKFSSHETNGHVYIYELAGLTNDMEAGKFWLFYTASKNNTDLIHFTQSPDQVIMKNNDHLIMWYKSVNI